MPVSRSSEPPPAKARRKEAPHAADPDAPRPLVLVVEDEEDLQALLAYNLERDGFRVACAGSGEEALQLARAELPDVALLDLMLPGMDGLEVCRALRAEPATAHVPIVMLTAKSEEADMVAGLELGADDYVTKPFSPRVLLARLRAVLRRRQQEASDPAGAPAILRRGDLVLDAERHEVRAGDRVVDLTATEFRLLELLMGRPGRVFTRHQVITAIHGPLAAVTDRSVDVQVLMLRRKLGPQGQAIQTVRGVGYRCKED